MVPVQVLGKLGRDGERVARCEHGGLARPGGDVHRGLVVEPHDVWRARVLVRGHGHIPGALVLDELGTDIGAGGSGGGSVFGDTANELSRRVGLHLGPVDLVVHPLGPSELPTHATLELVGSKARLVGWRSAHPLSARVITSPVAVIVFAARS